MTIPDVLLALLHLASRRRAAAMLVLAFAVLACGDDAEIPQEVSSGSFETVSLNVRVHLLQSFDVEALNSMLSDAEVETLLAAVNEVWAQAGITWRLESVVREQAQNGTDYQRALNGQAPATFQLFSSIVPRDKLLVGEWDVFVIKDLGDIAGGVYLGGLGLVIFAEFGPVGPQGADGPGKRILAHELGHSLGLDHVPCTPEGNLMAPGCPSENRTRLSATQIRSSREQALRGRPFGL